MATLNDFVTRVRHKIGVGSLWSTAEIESEIIDSIREITELVCLDALHDLLRYYNQTFNGTIDYFTLPTAEFVHIVVELTVDESDDLKSRPWDEVDPLTFDQILRYEGQASYNSTTKRIFTIKSNTGNVVPFPFTDVYSGVLLYPIPPDGYHGRLQAIIRPSESGGMTLPPFLHQIVIHRAIAGLADKKSFDVNMSDRFHRLWMTEIQAINDRYFGRFGLATPQVGQVASGGVF